MKHLGYIAAGILMMTSFGSIAQELAPDQNPNYKNSAEKYAQQVDALTATQSTTVHDTYEAYDWREAKAEAKQVRAERSYELRKLRYQSRYNCRNNYPRRYYNNGYYHNGYNNAYNNALLGTNLYYLFH